MEEEPGNSSSSITQTEFADKLTKIELISSNLNLIIMSIGIITNIISLYVFLKKRYYDNVNSTGIC